MEILNFAVLFVAALVAGALNAVAGGGSFITLPTLIATGVPDLNANMTNTIALWPGSAASVGAYRAELDAQRRVLIPLSVISLFGGLIGAILLRNTTQQTFSRMLPFLMLFATLTFTFSPSITKRLRERNRPPQQAPTENAEIPMRIGPSSQVVFGVVILQLVVAVYGGFFGGGIGMMMLGVLALMGMNNIHAMNALKTLLATCINGVALIVFVFAGQVWWPQAVLMIVGAVIGGYGGAFYARKLNPKHVRRFVVVVGWLMTIYFFVRP